MSKKVFIVLNIIYFVFNFCVVEYLPNPILFGWLPLQLVCWFGCVPVSSLLWWGYFHSFFAKQKDI